MKQWNTSTLLDRLSADVRHLLLEAERLKAVPAARLIHQPQPGSWSAAQVLEHLNVYCRYYLPAMEKAASEAPQKARPIFKPGWLGAFATKAIEVDERGAPKRKMKAPKSAVPPPQSEAQGALAEFITHQHHLLNLLSIATAVDIGGARVPISIARFIKLKLGDTLRFFVAHQLRHAGQWKRAVGLAK